MAALLTTIMAARRDVTATQSHVFDVAPLPISLFSLNRHHIAKSGPATAIGICSLLGCPSRLPSFHTTPKLPAKIGSLSSVAANRSIKGSNRTSGMVGMRS
jgi:hypothetical protein